MYNSKQCRITICFYFPFIFLQCLVLCIQNNEEALLAYSLSTPKITLCSANKMNTAPPRKATVLWDIFMAKSCPPITAPPSRTKNGF